MPIKKIFSGISASHKMSYSLWIIPWNLRHLQSCYHWGQSEFGERGITMQKLVSIFPWFFLIDTMKNHKSMKFRKGL